MVKTLWIFAWKTTGISDVWVPIMTRLWATSACAWFCPYGVSPKLWKNVTFLGSFEHFERLVLRHLCRFMLKRLNLQSSRVHLIWNAMSIFGKTDAQTVRTVNFLKHSLPKHLNFSGNKSISMCAGKKTCFSNDLFCARTHTHAHTLFFF